MEKLVHLRKKNYWSPPQKFGYEYILCNMLIIIAVRSFSKHITYLNKQRNYY